MDQAIQTLLSWQFIMFCLGVAAITFVCRKTLEFFITKKHKQIFHFWSEVAVPIMPLVLGGLIARFAIHYPFPEGVTTNSGRFFFGLVAGMLSGLVYKVVKSFLMKAAPAKAEKSENN